MPHPFLSAELIGNRVYECFDLKDYVLHLIIGFQSFCCLAFQKKPIFNNILLLEYTNVRVNSGQQIFVVLGIPEKRWFSTMNCY